MNSMNITEEIVNILHDSYHMHIDKKDNEILCIGGIIGYPFRVHISRHSCIAHFYVKLNNKSLSVNLICKSILPIKRMIDDVIEKLIKGIQSEGPPPNIKINDTIKISQEFINRTGREFNSHDSWIVDDVCDSLCGCNIISMKNKRTGEYTSLPDYNLILQYHEPE